MRKLLTLLLAAILSSAACLAQQTSSPFSVRGLHVDLRTQVMTVPALKALADKMAAGGMNTLLMEWEASLPFKRNATLSNQYAYTEDEIRDFVAYCNNLGIDVIPLQNCFGHCEYILRHDRYASLREDWQKFSQVCPMSGKIAEDTFRSIFQDVIDLHTSKYIHIGADETRLLGHCKKCGKFVKEHGTSELFVQYVTRMCKVVEELGKTPIIWGDIIAKYPEAADKLPKNLIVMEWNYGWDLRYFGDIEKLLDAGLQVWGAPALRSHPDNLYIVMWDKHLGNLENYVEFCKKKGFHGLIETSWSTSGQYGQIVDGAIWALNDMQPIREVYPLAAFDLLEQAFFKSCKAEKFNARNFVRRYAAEHYGLEGGDVDIFESYFYTKQNVIGGKTFKQDFISKELETFEKLQKQFDSLRPGTNRKDFDQLALMLDIRVNYLKFQNANIKFEANDFNSDEKKSLAEEIKPILKECHSLQQRFIKMNKDSLKNPKASFGDWSYLNRMQIIYNSLRR